MYNLRSTAAHKRGNQPLEHGRNKSQKKNDDNLFDPKSFTKDNGYDNIPDSSDSESDNSPIADSNGGTSSDEFNPENPEINNNESIESDESDGSDASDGSDEPDKLSESDKLLESDKLAESVKLADSVKLLGSIELELDEDGQVDRGYDPDKDNYFDLSMKPLINMLTQRLKSKFPDLPAEDLKMAVKKAIEKARHDMVDEYCEAKPKDTSWKSDLTPEEVTILEPKLKQLRKTMEDNTPTIPKILKSGLSDHQMLQALQLYDALKNTEPYTEPHTQISQKIMNIINSSNKVDEFKHNDILESLHNKIIEQIPTPEKIITAKLTENDKLRALQLCESMQKYEHYTETWLDLQNKINSILNSSLSSDEEVASRENEETLLKDIKYDFNRDLKEKILALDTDPTIKGRIYSMYCEMITPGISDSKYNNLKDKIMW